MPSSITVLSFPVVKKKLQRPVEVVQQRLDQLRKSRFLRRASQRRTKRNAFTNATDSVSRSASAVVQRISKMLRRVFKPSKRVSGIAQYAGGVLRNVMLAVGRTARHLASLPGIKTLVEKLRSLRASNLLSLSFTKQGRDKRQRRLRGAFLSGVVCGILVARIKKLRKQRATLKLAPLAAAEFVNKILGEGLAERIIALRLRILKAASAVVIQRAWGRWKARRADRARRKLALLSLMGDAQSYLQQAEEYSRVVVGTAQTFSAKTMVLVNKEVTRRWAVRLIQRVWRGSRARLRVYSILSEKKRRAYLKLQRQRVRKAREALLAKTPQQVAEQRALAKRLAARLEPTPVKNPRAARIGGATKRTSICQPLTYQQSPPRVSAVTGARVLPVGIAKYEKIRTTHARVNPLNLWVAIPISYHEMPTSTSTGNEKGQRHVAARAHGFLKAKFDWVPATLLASQPDVDLLQDSAK